MTDDTNKLNADRLARAAKYRVVFSLNVTGREVLADLEKQFAKAPDLSGTQEAMLKSYLRSAQRAMLDHIHMQIHIAEQGDPLDIPEATTGEAP
jgi:hypothetical protein